MDFLTSGPNLAFLVTGCIVLALLITGVVSLALGAGFDALHHSIDFNADLNGNGIPDHLEMGHFNLMGWFNPGHVPSTIFLILFCGIFSILGYSGQWIFLSSTGSLAPWLLAVPVALLMTLPSVRGSTMLLAPLVPKDETNAILLESLVGFPGVVTAGPIGFNDFGMARFSDDYGTDHMLMVSSESEEVIATGSSVVLLGQHRERQYAYIVRKI